MRYKKEEENDEKDILHHSSIEHFNGIVEISFSFEFRISIIILREATTVPVVCDRELINNCRWPLYLSQ